MKVLKEIARGGFGRVEMVQMPDGDILARKVFDPNHYLLGALKKEELLKRFEREVLIQKQLDNEYFVPIISYDFTESNPYFLMPLADETFEDEINRCRKNNEIPKGLSDILNSLEELHNLGLVHRDLKPSNILLIEGKWKLSDFGLVSAKAKGLTTITVSGNAFGTEHYCAPEQANDFKRVGITADIYSFGAILHDIFSGNPRVPYSKLSYKGPVSIVMEKCTEFLPTKRFQNIADVRNSLLTILSEDDKVDATPDIDGWIKEFQDISNFTTDKLNLFLSFIRDKDHSELSPVYRIIDATIINYLYNISGDDANELAEYYSHWTAETNFDFNFCDVVITRLQEFYNTGDASTKALVAVSACIMGTDHNRWYVMQKVIVMCSTNINSTLARRISIEIISRGVRSKFRRCVEGVSQSIDVYHDEIRKVLK